VKRSLACLLLGFWPLGPAAALGLGDLALHSRLGQPLHASVAVLDAPADIAANCFHLGAAQTGLAAPPPVELRLEQAGGALRLHLRSRDTVNDPILQFSLVTDCQARLQRDYTALLDPPLAIAPPVTAEPAAPTQSDAVPVRRAPAVTAASNPSSPHARTGTPKTSRHSAPPHAGNASQPKLILSGRHRTLPDAGGFGLRLDTTLPDPARAVEVPLTETELSDENTALTRKLAHLETQLAELQKRNAELETRRAAATAAVPPPQPESAPRWPLYLLLAALLAGAAGLIAWLRGRSRQTAERLPDTLGWTPPATPPPGDTADEPPAAPVAPVEDKPAIRLVDTLPTHAQTEGTEVKEDVLDQAEVFMAFGHGDLAVHLLQEHLRESPTESPVPWLLLLDLLHRAGDAAGYAVASAECRRYFNVNLSGHPISQEGNDPGPGLEAYPHLLEKLVNVWSTPEVNAFFEDLIYDNRGGTRVGFEPSAYRDILMLRDIARQSLPLAA